MLCCIRVDVSVWLIPLLSNYEQVLNIVHQIVLWTTGRFGQAEHPLHSLSSAMLSHWAEKIRARRAEGDKLPCGFSFSLSVFKGLYGLTLFWTVCTVACGNARWMPKIKKKRTKKKGGGRLVSKAIHFSNLGESSIPCSWNCSSLIWKETIFPRAVYMYLG